MKNFESKSKIFNFCFNDVKIFILIDSEIRIYPKLTNKFLYCSKYHIEKNTF